PIPLLSHRQAYAKGETMTDTKVAMIVGGGSGMGAASARKLAENGYSVAVMSSSGKGEALAKDLGGLGFTGSNLSPRSEEHTTEMTMDRFGRIDLLVTGAAHG